MEKLVNDGRTTAGPRQANNVPVQWRRFLDTPAGSPKATAKKTAKAQ
jgi:hypothetical protein